MNCLPVWLSTCSLAPSSHPSVGPALAVPRDPSRMRGSLVCVARSSQTCPREDPWPRPLVAEGPRAATPLQAQQPRFSSPLDGCQILIRNTEADCPFGAM